MSRSFKKTPWYKGTDKYFKQLANKAFRRKVKQIDLESDPDMLPVKKEVVNQYDVVDYKFLDSENKYNVKRK